MKDLLTRRKQGVSRCLNRGLTLLSSGVFASVGTISADESPDGNFRTEVAEIRIEAREGLLFHPARFKAKAGSLLEVTLHNADPNDMPHNLCLVFPGTLSEIQQASLAIDSEAEARGFVPDHPAVLAHTKLIDSEESDRFSFQLPEDVRGIYYLICTFPGHASVMYSPLYVGLNPRFDLANDPEVSPLVKQKEERRLAALENVERPAVLRVIMEDTGPASILVALPGDLNYCWDANTCRLRYAWKGNFVNPLPHFEGNGSKYPVILGDEFWRSLPGEAQAGIGLVDPDTAMPEYLGYDLDNGIPTFRYRIGEREVLERLTAVDGVLRWTFQTEEGVWRILAPDVETAAIHAPDGRRENEWLVFSRNDDQRIEIEIRPDLP